NLHTFYCRSSKLSKIENLPDGLCNLDCSYNPITKIENLPDNILIFSYNRNQITKYETLPVIKYYSFSLKEITASYINYHNIDINKVIPNELSDYLNSFNKKCFNCKKKNFIFTK